jgi:hypothetical protein
MSYPVTCIYGNNLQLEERLELSVQGAMQEDVAGAGVHRERLLKCLLHDKRLKR